MVQTQNNRTSDQGDTDQKGQGGITITPSQSLRDAVENLIILKGRQTVPPEVVATHIDTIRGLMNDHPDATYGVEGVPPKGPGWWLVTMVGADVDISSRAAIRRVTNDIRLRLRSR